VQIWHPKKLENNNFCRYFYKGRRSFTSNACPGTHIFYYFYTPIVDPSEKEESNTSESPTSKIRTFRRSFEGFLNILRSIQIDYIRVTICTLFKSIYSLWKLKNRILSLFYFKWRIYTCFDLTRSFFLRFRNKHNFFFNLGIKIRRLHHYNVHLNEFLNYR